MKISIILNTLAYRIEELISYLLIRYTEKQYTIISMFIFKVENVNQL